MSACRPHGGSQPFGTSGRCQHALDSAHDEIARHRENRSRRRVAKPSTAAITGFDSPAMPRAIRAVSSSCSHM